jgi:hypothetical protein
MANFGYLGVSVWPTYVGIAAGDPGPGPVPDHEPFGHVDYERGQIHWRTENGEILGRAQISVPKGVYTHLVFCYGPIQEMQAGPGHPLEQPIVFDRAGFIDLDPIQNQSYLPSIR